MIKAANGICQICGKPSKKLEAHHEDYSNVPTLILCTSCHKKEDGKMRTDDESAIGQNISFYPADLKIIEEVKERYHFKTDSAANRFILHEWVRLSKQESDLSTRHSIRKAVQS